MFLNLTEFSELKEQKFTDFIGRTALHCFHLLVCMLFCMEIKNCENLLILIMINQH